ncbi:MAG: segregation/condensation protein A [Candidatus Micrarchaeia archaeon]|jgi:segregation and condensation protein A
MDLLELVVKPTWKEFLIELVASNQMNPWEIDIVSVADKYLQKVRQLTALDLRVPANVILASALLLRFKAEALQLEEEEAPETVVEEAPQYFNEEIPELILRANKPRRRKLTLEELIQAVDDVMKATSKPLPVKTVPQMLSIQLPKVDMNDLMREVYEQAIALKDEEGVVLFTDLLKRKAGASPCPGEGNSHAHGFWCYGTENVVMTLMPVLHLVQENKLLAWQDQLFGEIFIKVVAEQQPQAVAQAN